MLVAGGGTGDDVLLMAEQLVDKEGQVEPECVHFSSVSGHIASSQIASMEAMCLEAI